MSRFLLAWELGGAFGHLGALRALALPLRERGHDVTLALSDCRQAETLFAGFTVLEAPIRGANPSAIAEPSTYADLLSNAGWGDKERLGELVGHWREVFDRAAPDIVVGNYAPTALLAAQGRRFPTVVFGTGFYSPPDTEELPDLCPWRDNYPDRLRLTERTVLETANRQLESQSVPPLARLTELYCRAAASLLTTYPEMDHYPDRTGGHYIGPWGELPGITPDWPPGDGPRVFAYLKRMEALPYVLAHLREKRWPTLVYAPEATDIATKFASRTLHVVDSPLDIREVAAGCSFAVLNAGHNATLRLLLACKPVLALPLNGEQQLVTRNVERLGAGLGIRPTQPVKAVACLNRLESDPTYAEAAQAFGSRYAETDQHQREARVVAQLESRA
ncbi:MAG: hypothetical protein AAF266_16145 [Planctomycetota bacterium]